MITRRMFLLGMATQLRAENNIPFGPILSTKDGEHQPVGTPLSPEMEAVFMEYVEHTRETLNQIIPDGATLPIETLKSSIKQDETGVVASNFNYQHEDGSTTPIPEQQTVLGYNSTGQPVYPLMIPAYDKNPSPAIAMLTHAMYRDIAGLSQLGHENLPRGLAYVVNGLLEKPKGFPNGPRLHVVNPD